jgi:hypothetical protein
MIRAVLPVLIILAVVFQLVTNREVQQPPGVLAPRAPIQTMLRDAQPILKDGYLITPLASFEVEARVLGAERYWFGRESDLSPVDLALGWGAMSSREVLDEIRILQGGRFYHWYARELPIPAHQITHQSANMHLIPATGEVAGELKSIRRGHLVRLEGYLVQINAQDGWTWRSSLTRADSGHGACEVVYVEGVTIL